MVVRHKVSDLLGAIVTAGGATENLRGVLSGTGEGIRSTNLADQETGKVGERYTGDGVVLVDDIELCVVEIKAYRKGMDAVHPLQVAGCVKIVFVEASVRKVVHRADGGGIATATEGVVRVMKINTGKKACSRNIDPY